MPLPLMPADQTVEQIVETYIKTSNVSYEKYREMMTHVEKSKPCLLKDSSFMEKVILHFGQGLEDASDVLQRDEKLVLIAVGKNGLQLEFASEDLKNNEEVVMTAIKQDDKAMASASDHLKNNGDFFTEALDKNVRYQVLKYADDALFADESFIEGLRERLDPRCIDRFQRQ